MRKYLSALALAAVISVHALPAQAIQCVPYAREATGMDIKGDAWKWWAAAAGRYDRGRKPQTDAILVFARQGKMRYGHVSVVRDVVHSRMILVDHANWAPARTAGRGKITHSVAVLDVSAKNDWSAVRVWYEPTGDFGDRVYRADGFIYNPNRRSAKGKISLQSSALQRAAAIMPLEFNTGWLHDKNETLSDGPASVIAAASADVIAAVSPQAAAEIAAEAKTPAVVPSPAVAAPAPTPASAPVQTVAAAEPSDGLNAAIAAAKASYRSSGSFLFN